MSSRSNKLWVLWLAGTFLFAALASGGCGGSSSSSGGSDINASWNGVWHFESGDMTLTQSNGSSGPMGIQDCAVYLASSDVEDDSGSAVMSFVSVFTYNNVLMPYLIDAEKVTTTRTDADEWKAVLNTGNYTVKMLGSDRMTVSGSFRNGDFATLAINATFKKVTQSQYTQIDNVDSVLNGTWRTSTEPNAQTGGGFMVMPSAFYAGSNAFANVIISDTKIASGTSKITATGFFRTAEGLLSPISIHNVNASVSRMFGNYYRVIINQQGAVLRGLFALQDTGKAQLIIEAERSGIDVHAVFMLEKKPASDSLNVSDFIPSSWSLTGGGTATYNGRFLPVAASDGFTVSMAPSASGSVSLTISGKLVSTSDSVTVKEFNDETYPVSFQHIGYNTLYAERSGTAETHRIIFTIISSQYAVVSDTATTSDGNGVSLVGNATKR